MNILGWSPETGEDNSCPSPSNGVVHCKASPSQEEDYLATPRSASSSLPSPAASAGTVLPASPKPHSARKRQANWVPRPQNCFFIFRQDFIKKHSRGGTEACPPSPKTAEKSLSKRAGEAWRQLDPSEKAEYERRADEEKVEHQKNHPDYRYRPTRNEKKRKGRIPNGRLVKGPLSPAPSSSSSRAPKRLKLCKAESELSFTDNHNSPFGYLQPFPSAHAEPVLESRRRSVSVPPFPFQRYQQPSIALGGVPHGLRRAASYSELQEVVSGPNHSQSMGPEELGFSEQIFNSSRYDARPMSGLHYSYPKPSHPEFAYNVPPLAAVSSALADWDGSEYRQDAHISVPHPLPPPLLSHNSWSSDSFLCHASPHSSNQSQIHSPAAQAPVSIQPEMNFIPEDHHPSITHEFPHYGSVHDTPLGEYSLEAVARTSALERFEMGLAEHACQGVGEYLSFDIPITEEQRLFEGMVELN
ncbi:hypothetical protein PM082_021009 [Marasmius tenuissimus]|nr:hypothetical protein PM082_021009 [Marasmius tenuissimus]